MKKIPKVETYHKSLRENAERIVRVIPLKKYLVASVSDTIDGKEFNYSRKFYISEKHPTKKDALEELKKYYNLT